MSARVVPARVQLSSASLVRVQFTLRDSQRIDLSVTRMFSGYLVHGVCLPPRFEYRGRPRCNGELLLGRLITRPLAAGVHSVRLLGIVGTRQLTPGPYWIRVRVAAAPGSVRVPLTIL